VAALSLASGEVLWRTEYTPIPLPKARSYMPPVRPHVWRNAAPVVAGNVVLATPLDCAELLALDLAGGELLWKSSQELLFGRAAEFVAFDQVIAADGGALYLGGREIRALEPGPGWTGQPRGVKWARSFPTTPAAAARAHGDGLFVPLDRGIVELDRASGAIRRSHATGAVQGLLVTGEALFVLADRTLQRIER
jgi:hypothetical protein